MSKCNAFYTTEDTDTDTCYHDNDECASGQNIKIENKGFGTDGRKLCANCKNIDK